MPNRLTPPCMLELKNKKILVTGGSGFIGQAVVENLISLRGVAPANIIIPRKETDDLRDFNTCKRLLQDNKIDLIIHLAAVMGGVGFSSQFPATQYYNNILMDLQLVEAARECNTPKTVLVSSSCAYPRDTTYPLIEENLWNGLPQETNRAYGVGKRILTVQAEAYRKQFGMNIVVVIPNNAYGPHDNFHPEYSHVIPSLIKKCLSGETPLVVWGDGTPTRDFLYVKDFAEGVILAAEKLETDQPINLGSGVETRIRDLVDQIKTLTGYTGEVVYDHTKPNGQPIRSVTIEKAKQILDFTPQYSLEQGLAETIAWYRAENNL